MVAGDSGRGGRIQVSELRGREAGGGEGVWAGRRMEGETWEISGIVYALAYGGGDIEGKEPGQGREKCAR